MGLVALLKKLGDDNGIELDDEELSQLGLTEEEAPESEIKPDPTELDVLGDTLSGEAAGAIEIFLSEPVLQLAGKKAIESDGLMWEPIIRAGQWATRPGPRGQKRRSPLKVIAGKSSNQRRQIGLQDIVDAFNDNAIQHVTVPTSHDNTVLENTGFIKGLKIVTAKIKDKATKTEKDVAVLMGGYDIKIASVKEKMQLGTIANRSAGILYDYVNTETGKTYPVALEHVALTNKPWITGMKSFGRKLVGKKLADTIGLSLSDDEPADDELLSETDALDGLELADATLSAWTQDEDPDWLRSQANNFLDAKRAEKAAKLMPNGGDRWVVMDGMPRYRCVRAKPGLALIADGWGDEANFWTAPIKVVDGYVELDENLEAWQAVKRELVKDEDRKEFPEGREPLAEKPELTEEKVLESLTDLARAQRARRARGTKTTGVKPDENTTHPRGGEHMAGENGNGLQLSDEARKLVEAAQAEAKAANKRADELSEKVDRLLVGHTKSAADGFIADLKRMDFDEEHGFGGVLTVVHDLLSADDGQPAIQSDKFATDDNSEGTLSLSQAVMKIFEAFKRGEDGKIALGQQVVQPTTEPGDKKDGIEGEPAAEVKLGEDGKPLPATPKDKEFEELSEEEQAADLLADDPELAAMLRVAVPAPIGSTEGGK